MGHLQRTPSVTVSLNLNAELPYPNILIKPFWRKFHVKESSILIGLETFRAMESLIMGWLG